MELIFMIIIKLVINSIKITNSKLLFIYFQILSSDKCGWMSFE